MKIAVTGAAGHIGSEICRALLHKGYEVKALVHQSSEAIRGLPVTKVKGNILNPDSLSTMMEGCDAVIHTAAVISLGYKFVQSVYDVNVTGTKNVFSAAKEFGVKRVVHFSSIHAFSQQPYDQPVDELCSFVSDNSVFYDQTKRDGHLLALDAVKGGQDIVIVCPTGVLGPPDTKPSKLGKAVIDIYRGAVPAVVKGGFDFVDVRDVASGAVAALEKGKGGEAYILGGHYFSIKSFSELVLEMKGKKKQLLELPLFVARLGLPFVRLYARIAQKEPLYDKAYLDILQDGNKQILSKKAAMELGYSPRLLQETLFDTINWFREAGKIK